MLRNLETLILDPRSEDATNTPYELTGRDEAHGIYLGSHSYPAAQKKKLFAGTIDSIGSRPANEGNPDNRTVAIALWVGEAQGVGVQGSLVNYIVNPSFEVDASNWVVNVGGEVLTRVTAAGQFNRGLAGLQVVTNSAAANQGVRPTAFTPAYIGQIWTAQVWIKGSAAGELVRIRLAERNSAGTQVQLSTTNLTLTTGWQTLAVTRTLTDPTTAQISMHIETQATATYTFFIDGAMLYQGPAGADYIDGSTTGGAWDGTAHASTSRRVTVPNLISQPSFETATFSRWVAFQSAVNNAFARSSAWASRGEYSIYGKWTASAASQFALARYNGDTAGAERMPITGGASYRVRADVKVLQKGENPLGLTVRWINDAGINITDVHVSPAGVTALGESTITGIVTAPAAAVSAQIFFGAYGIGTWMLDIGEVIEFYLDALMMAPIAADGYFDGDTPAGEWTGAVNASFSVLYGTGDNRVRHGRILSELEQKVEKLSREGGTLRRILPAGDSYVFDIEDAAIEVGTEKPFNQGKGPVNLSLVVDPLPRGTEVAGTDKAETTLPVVIQTEAAGFVKGSGPARGRLVIDDDQNAARSAVIWGIQSRYLDTSADAALFYEAEGRTGENGSASFADATGSGGNVMRSGTLTTTEQSILSTQATGAGNHLRHIGGFKVYARIKESNSHEYRFEWAEGDFRATRRNPIATCPSLNDWHIIDLGLVRLTKAAAGAQRWQGRLTGRVTTSGISVSTNAVRVDWIAFIPIDEGSGRIEVAPKYEPPLVATIADEFAQAASPPLTGQTMRSGGAWTNSGIGSGTDFTIDSALGVAKRSLGTADTAPGRLVLAGATTFTDLVASVDVYATIVSGTWTVQPNFGLVLFTDATHYVKVNLQTIGPWMVSATPSLIGVGTSDPSVGGGRAPGGPQWEAPAAPFYPAVFYRLTVMRQALTGQVIVWLNRSPYSTAPGAGSTELGDPVLYGSDASLATGGALASVKVGIFHYWTGTATFEVRFDNFSVGVPIVDLALPAQQSVEIRHDRVIREDTAGALWTPVSDYRGDYLRLPPAGIENRALRWIVLPSRGVPGQTPDTAIDDTSARMYSTPVYDHVPDPT